MDPYTRFEYFEAENKQLYVISENKSGKIKQEDVLKEILEDNDTLFPIASKN